MSFLTMTGSFYHFQYYEITDRFPFLSVHIGPVNLFSSFDHADFIHSADLLQMAHRLCLCRVLKIQKCVGVFVAALVCHVRDVDPLSRKDRGDLADHVRNICVEQGDSSCNLAYPHVACRVVYGILDISVFQVIL